MKHRLLIKQSQFDGRKREASGILPDGEWYHCIARNNSIRVKVYSEENHRGKTLFEKTLLLADEEGNIAGVESAVPTKITAGINAVIRPYIPHSNYSYMGGDICKIPDKPFRQICSKILWSYVEDSNKTFEREKEEVDAFLYKTLTKPKIDTTMQTTTALPARQKGRNQELSDEQGIIFARNLRFLRIKNHLKQTDLAKKIGYSNSTIGHWERTGGRVRPSLYSVQLVANKFKVALEDLTNKDLFDGSFDENALSKASVKVTKEPKSRKKRKRANCITKAEAAILAKNMLFLRRKNGLNQVALADKIGVNKSQIGMWENKKHLPEISTVHKIALGFGVSFDDLTTQNLNDGSVLPQKVYMNAKPKKLSMKPKVKKETSEPMLSATQKANFRKNILTLRLQQKKSQVDIAKLIGVSGNTVWMMENNGSITMDKVAKMAKAFGTGITDLIDRRLAPAPEAPAKLMPMGKRKYTRKPLAITKTGVKPYPKLTGEAGVRKFAEESKASLVGTLMYLGFPKEQAFNAYDHKFTKEDAEAVILGMATKFKIDLHVGDGIKVDNVYKEVIKEQQERINELSRNQSTADQFKIITDLQDKVQALQEENTKLRSTPAQVVEKDSNLMVTLNVKDKGLFGGSVRKVHLNIYGSNFSLTDPEERIHVDSVTEVIKG